MTLEAIAFQLERWTSIAANTLNIVTILAGALAAGPVIRWFVELRAELTLVRRHTYYPDADISQERVEPHRQIRLGTPNTSGDAWRVSWTGIDGVTRDSASASIVARSLRTRLVGSGHDHVGKALSGEIRYTRTGNDIQNVEITALDYMDGDVWSRRSFQFSQWLKRLLGG